MEAPEWKTVAGWVEDYRRAEPCMSARIGNMEIKAGSGMIGLGNPRTGLVQIIDPRDFEIGKMSADARIIACSAGEEGSYFVYVLNPGSGKAVLLELILEKEAFGVYSQDYPIGFSLSGEYCASALGKNLLIVDFREKKYVFTNERGERFTAGLEAKEGAACTVLDAEAAAVCTRRILYVVRNGKRIGISAKEALGKKEFRNPEFGAGEAGRHRWLALKDGNMAVLVSLTDKDMGYMAIRKGKSGFEGKEPMQ